MNDVTDRAAPAGGAGRAAQELEYRLRQTELITEFGCFAFKTHDIDALLQEASRVTALGLNSEMSKVLEYLPVERQFVVRAGVGWKPGVVGTTRIGGDLDSPAGYAFKTEKPVTSNHLSDEGRFRTPAMLLDHGVERAINVIIRAGENCYGVLEVDSPNGGRFDQADTDFLQGFANLLGVAIDRQQLEARLRQALDDQELLTQEISHRVKNSLSIVSSLLAMQRKISDHTDVQRALSDAEARVQTIGHVHDRLWRHKEVRTIDLADFLTGLSRSLSESSPKHIVTCEVSPASITTDRAVTLGLIANELITNAIKYAYPGATGEVKVSLTQVERDRLRFAVEDGGIGLPDEMPGGKSASLGMRLIDTLSRQLGGSPAWQDVDPGTRFVLEFPA